MDVARAYRDALARDPRHVEAANGLWRCLAILGRGDEAREAALRFLDLAPTHPDGVDAEAFLGLAPGETR